MPAAGVPASTPVAGGEGDAGGQGAPVLSLSVGAGKPVAVTVNVPQLPTVNVVLVGAGDRRRLVDGEGEGLVASGPTPLAAVMCSA